MPFILQDGNNDIYMCLFLKQLHHPSTHGPIGLMHCFTEKACPIGRRLINNLLLLEFHVCNIKQVKADIHYSSGHTTGYIQLSFRVECTC